MLLGYGHPQVDRVYSSFGLVYSQFVSPVRLDGCKIHGTRVIYGVLAFGPLGWTSMWALLGMCIRHVLCVSSLRWQLLVGPPYDPSEPFTQTGPLDSHWTLGFASIAWPGSLDGGSIFFFNIKLLNLWAMDQGIIGMRMTTFLKPGSIIYGSFHPSHVPWFVGPQQTLDVQKYCPYMYTLRSGAQPDHISECTTPTLIVTDPLNTPLPPRIPIP